MGQLHTKELQLSEGVRSGNVEEIRALCRDGADLEWAPTASGRTPLILACMESQYDVAKTLIELGANVNAYYHDHPSGTPLHYAAIGGLENIVKLLLSHGANPLVLNNLGLTPLKVARFKKFSNVVRAIESHICLFSGWMREFYGPDSLDLSAPQVLSRRVWVVIVPTCSRYPTKLELVVYASLQDAKPRTVMALWKANLEEPQMTQSDTSVIISRRRCPSHGRRGPQGVQQTRLKLAPANEGDKQQLEWFCDVCKGFPQPMHPPPSEDELAMAMNASLHTSMSDTTNLHHHSVNQASSSSGPSSSTAPPPSGKASAFGTCSICLDAPSEAVCVPCGHVAGCMSCLNKMKSKKWGCPVCRAKIVQVIKLYSV